MSGLRKRDHVEACAQSMATTKLLLNLERRRLRPRAGLESVAGICVCGAGGRVAHVGPAGRCDTIARCWLNCEPTANKWTKRLRIPIVRREMQPRSTDTSRAQLLMHCLFVDADQNDDAIKCATDPVCSSLLAPALVKLLRIRLSACMYPVDGCKFWTHNSQILQSTFAYSLFKYIEARYR